MIGDLVAQLIAAGTPPELAAMVVTEAFAAGAALVIPRNSGGIPVDETAEKRRAYDRKRKNKSTGIPPDSTGIPPETENASLSKKERIEEGKEVREARKARASQLPDGWRPGENAWQAAVDRIGLDRSSAELTKFKNHAADKGRVSKRWDAAWQNWVDRALDYGGGMGTKGNSNGRRTVHDAARDLSANVAARLREFDEPAPELCDETGRAPLRLLPSR